MAELDALIDESGFSGAVRVSRAGVVEYERASGFADRAHEVPNALDTQFGAASFAKSFTALTVMSLISDGALALDSRVRDIVQFDELALVDAGVTIEQLMAHTSGIGDYFDEDAFASNDEYELPVPVHTLEKAADYLILLAGHPTKFAAGTQFSYCNGSYLILALVVEAVTGDDFYDAVAQRVFAPAGMSASAFLRSDQLPGTAAIGYLHADEPPGWRTNQLKLPVRGSGDGGVYTTVSDMDAFWRALAAGAIVPPPMFDAMTTPREPTPHGDLRHGLGFWLRADRALVSLEGSDAGVSCWSGYEPESGRISTVLSNTSDGAWPLARGIEAGIGS